MIEPEIIFTKEQYEKYYSERFIYSEKLLKIIDIMKNYNNYRILILGAPGSGKSTLLKLLSYHTANKECIKIIHGYNIRDFNFNLGGQNDCPLFIDGLDEMQNPNELLHYISKKDYDRVVCTSRFNVPFEIDFTHIITLKPLTQNQIMQLITKIGLNERFGHSIISNQHIRNRVLTPKDVLSLAIADINDFNVKEFYSKYRNLLYQYGNGINFNSDIVLPDKDLIVPSKDIITGVTIINASLLKRAKDDPKIIDNISSREFEEMVCELLDKQGYNVKLTKQSRDGGKDIIVVQKSVLGEFCIYVECKKYDKSNPISVKLVRELYGTVMADDATAGMIITTSYFTRDAKEYRDKIKHRMTLKDYNDLIQEINSIQY